MRFRRFSKWSSTAIFEWRVHICKLTVCQYFARMLIIVVQRTSFPFVSIKPTLRAISYGMCVICCAVDGNVFTCFATLCQIYSKTSKSAYPFYHIVRAIFVSRNVTHFYGSKSQGKESSVRRAFRVITFTFYSMRITKHRRCAQTLLYLRKYYFLNALSLRFYYATCTYSI